MVPRLGLGGGTELVLDTLCGHGTDEQRVVSLERADDGAVEHVAADLEGGCRDDLAHAKHCDLGGSPAHIDDHVACGALKVELAADGGRQRGRQQEGLAWIQGFARVSDRPQRDLGRILGHGHGDARANPARATMERARDVQQQRVGDVVLGDAALSHGAHRLDVFGAASQHGPGCLTHGHDLAAPGAARAHGDHGGHGDDHAVSLSPDPRMGRAEIEREVCREQTEDRTEHGGLGGEEERAGRGWVACT